MHTNQYADQCADLQTRKRTSRFLFAILLGFTLTFGVLFGVARASDLTVKGASSFQ